MASGIYLITNTTNGKTYVGKTRNLDARIYNHKSRLRRNRHSNKYLQNAWNRNGENAFEFDILELVDESLLGQREHFWVSKYDSLNRLKGYNIEDIDPLEGAKIVSEETREKLRQYKGDKHHGYGKPMSQKQKDAIKAANTGRKCSEATKKRISESKAGKTPNVSPEVRKRMSLALSLANKGKVSTPNLHLRKTIVIRSPSGEIVTVTGIAAFCRSNNLKQANLNKVIRGKRQSAHGWTCPAFDDYWKEQLETNKIESKTRILKAVEKLKAEFTIISPTGEVFQAVGISEFCREHKLNVGNFHAVLKGKRNHCKGWRLTEKLV